MPVEARNRPTLLPTQKLEDGAGHVLGQTGQFGAGEGRASKQDLLTEQRTVGMGTEEQDLGMG